MKKEIADKWVAALRSDKYKQGVNFLHDRRNDAYCCLGVLCKIAIEDGVEISVKPSENSKYEYTIFDNEDGCLPPKVMDYSGIKFADALIDDVDYNRISLITMNDGDKACSIEQHSFDEIADFIEKNWERL